MKGYVAITRNDWIESVRVSGKTDIVFWKKRLLFKALETGENFYFLNRVGVNEKRVIVGKATFEKFEIAYACDAWEKYGECLGGTKTAFSDMVKKMCGSYDSQIGCICLSNVKFFNNPILVEELSIEISPFTVSGKKLSENQCEEIERKCREHE